jgi:hypothetical protein
MNTAANEDPMGPEYWIGFERRHRQMISERNARNALYGGQDPATGGWRPARPETVIADPLEGVEQD